jgi:hypothetical protein
VPFQRSNRNHALFEEPNRRIKPIDAFVLLRKSIHTDTRTTNRREINLATAPNPSGGKENRRRADGSTRQKGTRAAAAARVSTETKTTPGGVLAGEDWAGDKKTRRGGAPVKESTARSRRTCGNSGAQPSATQQRETGPAAERFGTGRRGCGMKNRPANPSHPARKSENRRRFGRGQA